MQKQLSKRKITIQGKEFESLRSVAIAFDRPKNTLDYRLSKGWTPEQAIGIDPPPSFASRTPGIPVSVEGRDFKNLKEAAKFYRRAYTHVIEMLKKGRSIEQALGLVKRADTLATENPEVAAQWHPSKNLLLTANDVSPGSGIKAWWLCSNNHEWQAVINSRNRGMGCPYCAGQKATSERNFSTEYPELLKEFDSEKNNNIDPKTLSPRANLKVWWKCKKGHSWQAVVTNRTRKESSGSCPYCMNRMLCEENSLAALRPDIAKDWHPTKNKHLTPNDVIAGGSARVWWICKHGHDWQTTVGLRVNAGTGCPKCTLQTSRIEIAVYAEIKALFTNVSWREKFEKYECDIYLPDQKIGIEIDGVYWHRKRPEVDQVKQRLFEKMGIQLYRLREEGLSLISERDINFKWSHSTFPTIANLIKKIIQYANLSDTEIEKLQRYVDEGKQLNEQLYRETVALLPAPPYELSLIAKRPEIAKDWAYDLNAPLSPEHFKPNANKTVWWRCEQGHAWKTTLNNRSTQNTGCPQCPRIIPTRATEAWNFAKVNPHLVHEWHPEKNVGVRPEGLTPNSNKKFWWKCNKNHEWLATLTSRSSGTGCPYCYGRYASAENNLAVLYPDLLREWDYELNKDLNPLELTAHVGKKAWWKCARNHSYNATIYNRTKNKSGCPHCQRINARKYSIEFFQEYALARGGKCLSTEYVSCRKKIKMVCKLGHEWETRADNILYEQHWCLRCYLDQKMTASLGPTQQLSLFDHF